MEHNLRKTLKIVVRKQWHDGEGAEAAGEDARNREKIAEGPDRGA